MTIPYTVVARGSVVLADSNRTQTNGDAKNVSYSYYQPQAYGMNDEFSRVLSQQMEYYSNDPNADRINRLKGKMSQVFTVMIENIDKVLERGDRLELLFDKTATMQNSTLRFKKKSRRYRNAIWWRNVKLVLALIFLLLVLVYVVVAFASFGEEEAKKQESFLNMPCVSL